MDSIVGATSPAQLKANIPVTFFFHYMVGADTVSSVSSGISVVSPDGTTWNPPVLDTIHPGLDDLFDLGIFIQYFSNNGLGADSPVSAQSPSPGTVWRRVSMIISLRCRPEWIKAMWARPSA